MKLFENGQKIQIFSILQEVRLYQNGENRMPDIKNAVEKGDFLVKVEGGGGYGRADLM